MISGKDLFWPGLGSGLGGVIVGILLSYMVFNRAEDAEPEVVSEASSVSIAESV